MVKTRVKHNDIILKDNEYVIRPENPDSQFYEVRYKGKIIKDVTGIIRIKIGD